MTVNNIDLVMPYKISKSHKTSKIQFFITYLLYRLKLHLASTLEKFYWETFAVGKTIHNGFVTKPLMLSGNFQKNILRTIKSNRADCLKNSHVMAISNFENDAMA